MKIYEIVRRNGDRYTVKLDSDFEIDRAIFYVKGYAKVRINSKDVALHRLIMGVTDPKVKVDHINGDTLDNRRSNLRIVTTSQNAMNRKAKGVYYSKRDKLWVAIIHIDGKREYISSHKKKEDAIRAYRKRHKEVFGEFSPWKDDDIE